MQNGVVMTMEPDEVSALAAALRQAIAKQDNDPEFKACARAALGKLDRTTAPAVHVMHKLGGVVENCPVLNRRKKDAELEAQACGMMRQYGFFLPGPAKAFFRELAGHMKWDNLQGQMK